jgi:hypothetical protein
VSSNVEETQIMTRQHHNGGDHSSQLEIKSPPLDQVFDKKILGSRLHKEKSRVTNNLASSFLNLPQEEKQVD